MAGDSNDTPTGGNGMDVNNLPDNMDGKPSSVIPNLNLQLNFQIDKNNFLKRRLKNKRNS